MTEILNCQEFTDKLRDLITEFEDGWDEGVKNYNWPTTQDSIDDWIDQFNSWLSMRDLQE
jgi:hypothetical protein